VLRHRHLQPRLGARKLLLLMQSFIQQHHLTLGRDAFFQLLRKHGLLVRKRKTRVQTTFSRHGYKKYQNLITAYAPLAPNHLWVCDITYLPLADSFAYLSLITDAYSKKIVGHCVSRTLHTDGCIKALKMALADCKNTAALIHHSDRGTQYCCTTYTNLLKRSNIRISMTENGDPLENAVAERVNGILKQELLPAIYPCFLSAEQGVAKAIEVYNTLRPHSSCNMLTPAEAHQKEGVLKKHWKNYYKEKEVEMADT
jgi:transposase InsO family protein